MSVPLHIGQKRGCHDSRFDMVAHNWNTPRLYAASLTGSVLGSLLMHPLDTLKIHAQVGNRLETRRPLFYTWGILRTYGVKHLYRGYQPVFAAHLTATVVRHGLTYQSTYSDTPLSYNAAITATLLASFATTWGYTKFDTAVTRLQADSAMALAYRRNYQGVYDTITRLRKEEGKKAYKKGISLGWFRYLFHTVAFLYLFPPLTNAFGGDNPASIVAAVLSLNFITSFITMPLDTAKVYLQVQPISQPMIPYPHRLAKYGMKWVNRMIRIGLRGARTLFAKARIFMAMERYKDPPRRWYYPRSTKKMLSFLRQRGLYKAYNGFWFYYYRNLSLSLVPYLFVEFIGKKRQI